jgi:transposase
VAVPFPLTSAHDHLATPLDTVVKDFFHSAGFLGLLRRAQVVLWSADAVAGAEIARRLHMSAEAVSRIRHRLRDTGVAGLATRPKAGRKNHAVPAPTVERLLELGR